MKMRSLIAASLVAGLALFSVAAADKKSADYVNVYSGEISTLNYLVSGSTTDQEMSANMVDTLVEYDRFGILRPALASSWTKSADGLTWTFKLKQGVKWVDYKGKEVDDVTAQDWVDAAKYVMTAANASQIADNLTSVVKGGKDFFAGKLDDFSQVGVKAKGKYELEYTLAKPVPYFLSMLTYASFLPVNGKFLAAQGSSFGTDNTAILYNGAYTMTDFEPQSSRVLTKNAKYWDAANVYIPRLVYKYNKEAATLGPELFLRGDVSYSPIPSSLLDSWMKDASKKAQIHPARTNTYSYFYALNFNPKFAAEFEPDNWKTAVNNLAFRKSLFDALDRKAALLTEEPYAPERRMQNTVTPRGFVNAGGKDYVDMGDLAAITKRDSFDKAAALKWKAQAMKELAGKVSFPVKIPMPYNSGSTEWTNRAQVIQQQIEGLLGTDYIKVIPEAFPPTGFLGATRRAGNYALQECNWGPDYADPQTYTDPFTTGANYNWPELATGYGTSGNPTYESLAQAAIAETGDMAKRYALFAKAEAYLINQAMIIPYKNGGGGWEASKLEPFASAWAPFGMSELKFKGQIVLAKPVSTEEFASLEKKWNAERVAALSKIK
ncbi:MAG TPA: peptide ABC transporter substrate-binding protein [Rectinemataceae bacterium]|nr:peptide ABC transporter substrate-binding protein [Rectinemataceae bacterium]